MWQGKNCFRNPFILTLGYVVLFPGIFAFLFWIKGIDIIGKLIEQEFFYI